jgi:histidinol-phosphate aminotransferase
LSGNGSVGGYRRLAVAADSLRLDLNESPRGAGPLFTRRVFELLAESEWNRYAQMDSRRAREAAAALYGWETAGTLVGNGSNELLAATVRALLPRGGRLLTLAPSFSMYPVLAARQGAQHLKLHLEPPEFTVDHGRLLELAPQADLVLLCSPNNPTGGLVPEPLMEEVLGGGKPVIWDAPYLEFSGLDSRPLLRRHGNLIVLRSLSKAWGLAGLRVGALLAGPELVGRVNAELLPFGTGWMVAAAYAAAAERRADGEALVADIVAERERQTGALARLPGVHVAPSAANFYMVRHEGLTGDELVRALAARGIAVRDLAELAQAGYVRVTVGSAVEGAALIAAMREVSRG